MRRAIVVIILFLIMSVPVRAVSIEPVQPSGDAEDLMPETTGNFTEDILYLLRMATSAVQPEVTEGVKVCLSVICAVLVMSVLQSFHGVSKQVTEMVGVVIISAVLVYATDSMISLGAETVQEISRYGKLLLPVLTGALAAQGGVTSSAALYAGTAMFDAVLCAVISNILIPMVYIFLVFGILSAALGEDILGKLKDFVKWLLTWCLKVILYVFTGYISITGVISGVTDQATVKATKITIAGVVPVVGGILSDASEAVVVGVSVAKSAAGIYGIVAMLAILIVPFLTIAVQSLMLKLTSFFSGIIGNSKICLLIETFSVAMGFLLAMTGTSCLMQMISVVCFMKGMS